MSPGAFGVYLIHCEPNMFKLLEEKVAFLFDLRILYLLPMIFVVVAIVFLGGTLADIIRSKIFKLVGLEKLCRIADKLPVVSWLNDDF